MSFYVAVVTDGIDRTTTRHTAWGHLATHPAKDPTSVAVDDLVRRGEVDDLLVITPHRLVTQAHVLAATVASVRPLVRTHVMASPHSPWASGRVVELLSTVVAEAPEMQARIQRLLDRAASGAWLPSVAKLESPAPGLRQHVRSLLPGGLGFLAFAGPDGWVDSLPLATTDARSLPGRVNDAGPGRVDGRSPRREVQCASHAELPEEAIAALYALGLERRPQLHERTGPPSPEWPASGAVEFVVAPADPLGPVACLGSCPTCRRPVAAMTCPFCHVSVTATALPAGFAPATTSTQGVSP